MTKMKMPATLVVLAAAGLLLSGCVTIESGPQGSDETPAASAPAEEQPQDESTETDADEEVADTEDSDDDEQEPGTEDSDDDEAEESSESVDIAGGEEGTVYARAHQAFSPHLVVWVVNEDESRIVYMERSCLGSIVEQGSGSYEQPADEDYTEIAWDANPFGNGLTSRVDLSEHSIGVQYSGEAATTSVEAAVDEYQGMCIDAGETVAEFVF